MKSACLKLEKIIITNHKFDDSILEEIFIGSIQSKVVFITSCLTNVKEYLNEFNYDFTSKNSFNERICSEIRDYLTGKSDKLDFEYSVILGTEFQKSVWNELLNIKRGKTLSYLQVAENIGQPSATRAVGTAIGKNPLPFIIPCHRVINTNGLLGGFSLGLEVKKLLLKSETGVSY